jgi:hypothetical protein
MDKAVLVGVILIIAWLGPMPIWLMLPVTFWKSWMGWTLGITEGVIGGIGMNCLLFAAFEKVLGEKP